MVAQENNAPRLGVSQCHLRGRGDPPRARVRGSEGAWGLRV